MIISQDKSQLLEDRMMQFALNVIQLTQKLPQSTENKIIADHLIRSASSVGANYAEANNAASKQDFRNKIFVAKKEAAESRYWLRLGRQVNLSFKDDFNTVGKEVSQLLMILQKIITTLKNAK